MRNCHLLPQVFKKYLPSGRSPAAWGDMNCTHQRLYPCFRMSSEARSSITLSLLCWPARCSINDVAEPLGKFSARILRARTEPNLFVSVLRRALSFGDEFSAHSSSGPTVNLSILASVPLFTLNTPRTGTPLPSGAGLPAFSGSVSA